MSERGKEVHLEEVEFGSPRIASLLKRLGEECGGTTTAMMCPGCDGLHVLITDRDCGMVMQVTVAPHHFSVRRRM